MSDFVKLAFNIIQLYFDIDLSEVLHDSDRYIYIYTYVYNNALNLPRWLRIGQLWWWQFMSSLPKETNQRKTFMPARHNCKKLRTSVLREWRDRRSRYWTW